MTLNEWGDFFAGVSAPIALLWLVIGYFQHGTELRLNTEALQTQQIELKRQVEETARLVEAAEKQYQAAQQDIQDRQEREKKEAEPDFVQTEGRGDEKAVDLYLQNRGGEARDVSVSLHFSGDYNFTRKQLIVPNDEPNLLTLFDKYRRPLEFPVQFSIHSTDRFRRRHEQKFEVSSSGTLKELSTSENT